MRTSRRDWILGSAATATSLLVGCTREEPRFRPTALPASRTPRDVLRVLTGQPTRDGAGVSLTRVIGQRELDHLDPFLLLDEIHSDVPNAYIAGFPDHPHRGFETISVMLQGNMRHRDSRGNAGLITGGGIQWMTAGRGIVHSEMPEQEAGMLWGFQLWLNLPRAEKMCAQRYQDMAPERITERRLPSNGLLRAIAGHTLDVDGPVEPRSTEPMLFTAMLRDEAPLEIDVPRDHNAFVFVHAGELETGPERRRTRVQTNEIAIFDAGSRVSLRGVREGTGILFAAARPLREPIARRGPFVMNTDAEIEQAFADYRAGRLG